MIFAFFLFLFCFPNFYFIFFVLFNFISFWPVEPGHKIDILFSFFRTPSFKFEVIRTQENNQPVISDFLND
jgi:hypothetical protein